MTTYSIDIPDDFADLQLESIKTLLEALDAHLNPLWSIRMRLETLANADRELVKIAANITRARDGAQPEKGAPLGAWPPFRERPGSAYPVGWVVRVGNKLFRAARDAVSTAPKKGNPDWVDVTAQFIESPPLHRAGML